jgi:hypothetical protein
MIKVEPVFEILRILWFILQIKAGNKSLMNKLYSEYGMLDAKDLVKGKGQSLST